MAYSYDEILERMCDKYYDMAGKRPEEVGDGGAKLKVLAQEIYSLGCHIDWIRNAMFVSTAVGEALDCHAEQRGLKRHNGNKAGGTILVRLDTPLEYDVVIPEGSVFTTSDGTLNFVSVGDAVIYSGTGSCFVDAEAQYSGSRYNVEPDEITTVVTYFSSGISSTNSSEFYGGSDDESDEELRKRIIESYRDISSGLNAAYYKKLAESVDGVYSANVVEYAVNDRNVNVFVAGKAGLVSNEIIAEVQRLFTENKIPGISIIAFSAVLRNISVSVNFKLKENYSAIKTRAAINNVVTEYFQEMRVGQDFIAAELGSRIIAIDGVKNYSFVNTEDQTASSSDLFCLQNLTLTKI